MSADATETKKTFDQALAALNVPEHAEFVLAFLDTRSKTAAAKRAGYAPGCAKQTGWRIFERDDVGAAIAAGLAWRAADSGVEVEPIDRNENVRVLKQIRDDPGARHSDRIKAIRELNLLGALHDAPKRAPGSGDCAPKVVVLQAVGVRPDGSFVGQEGNIRDVTPQPKVIEHDPGE